MLSFISTDLLLGLVFGLIVTSAGALVLYRRLTVAHARAQDAERLAELGTLTGGLAHEIKNPLSTIQLNLQLLQEALADDKMTSPRVASRAATITREAQRLRAILDDFLRYAGRLHVQPESTDLTELVGDLVDFLSPAAQQSGTRVRLQPADAPVIATVDPKLIKQAMLNLMLNAMQAVQGDGEIIVGVARHPGRIALTVTDTGPGISAEDQARVFDAYFSKRRGGTGLGLAMTRRIAQAHGGDVHLASVLGQGSSFSINLPM